MKLFMFFREQLSVTLNIPLCFKKDRSQKFLMDFFKSLKFGVEMLCKVMGRACAQAMDLLISALHIRSSKIFFA